MTRSHVALASLALAGLLVAGYLGVRARGEGRAQPVASAPPQDVAATGGGAAGVVEGDVLEAIAGERYTYLRIGAADHDAWAAVAATKVALGAHVRVIHALRVPSYANPRVGRTFAPIWFGALDDGSGAAVAPPAGFLPAPQHSSASAAGGHAARVGGVHGGTLGAHAAPSAMP